MIEAVVERSDFAVGLPGNQVDGEVAAGKFFHFGKHMTDVAGQIIALSMSGLDGLLSLEPDLLRLFLIYLDPFGHRTDAPYHRIEAFGKHTKLVLRLPFDLDL